jgi:hypothetical protein
MSLPVLPGVALLRNLCRSQAPENRRIARQTTVKLEKVCRSCRRNRRGAAAVEFAVVAPVFFLLVFGMIEFGRMVMVQQVITNASREGARVGVLDGSTESEVRQLVVNYLTNAGVAGACLDWVPAPKAYDDVTGTEKLFPGDYGDAIEVTVHVPFDQVSWLPSPMFLGGNTLTATTVMRRETVQ